MNKTKIFSALTMLGLVSAIAWQPVLADSAKQSSKPANKPANKPATESGVAKPVGKAAKAEKGALDSERPTQGGLLPGETREEKRERLLKGLEEQVGPLSKDQKNHILAIYAAAGDEMGAARANYSLTETQRSEIVSRVHGDIFNRIAPVLTDAQRDRLKAARDARRADQNREAKSRNGRTGVAGVPANESPEQRRVRILKRYEEVLPDLTAAQKNQIVTLLVTEGDRMKANRNDPALTDAQSEALNKEIHVGIADKVDALLTDTQRPIWQKAREERRIKALAEKERGGVE